MVRNKFCQYFCNLIFVTVVVVATVVTRARRMHICFCCRNATANLCDCNHNVHWRCGCCGCCCAGAAASSFSSSFLLLLLFLHARPLFAPANMNNNNNSNCVGSSMQQPAAIWYVSLARWWRTAVGASVSKSQFDWFFFRSRVASIYEYVCG